MSKDPIYMIKLSCGHKAATRVLLVNQYPSDVHYVFCPACRQSRNNILHSSSAWVQPVAFMEVPRVLMHNVLSGIAYVMPEDIMRLQPSKPPTRQRPYYYRGIRR